MSHNRTTFLSVVPDLFSRLYKRTACYLFTIIISNQITF
nr:MAG TPA: hypothetical protein [Caudoviricetes sp.]